MGWKRPVWRNGPQSSPAYTGAVTRVYECQANCDMAVTKSNRFALCHDQTCELGYESQSHGRNSKGLEVISNTNAPEIYYATKILTFQTLQSDASRLHRQNQV